MSLTSNIKQIEVYPICNFNTGTLYDYQTGDAVRGVDGKWYITGGMPNAINGAAGKGSTYKSTFVNSLIMKTMLNYANSENITTETEGSYDEHRLLRLSKGLVNINDITFLRGSVYDIGETFNFIKEVIDEKVKHKKDYTIETPFLNLRTGKPNKSWIPTFVTIDSFSEFYSDAEKLMLEGNGLDDKKNQTVWLVDGNKKAMFIRTMRRWCEQYGIVLTLVSHIGKNAELDSYAPTPKQLQFMKQADKMKNVSSKFEFLTRNCSQIMSSKIAHDSNKKALYSKGATPANDINEIIVNVIRCKDAPSGVLQPYIVSQSDGLLNSTTNYNYLRQCGYYGLLGNKQTHQSALFPEENITRNSFREKSDKSYELSRAIELTAQYTFIRNNWNTTNVPLDFTLTPEQIYEKLNNNNSIKISDILNSEGVWKYNRKKNDRKYMCIFDVLELIKNK